MSMLTSHELRARARDALAAVGVKAGLDEPGEPGLPASTPITGEVLLDRKSVV